MSQVKFTTSLGAFIALQLDAEKAPKTVENFSPTSPPATTTTPSSTA